MPTRPNQGPVGPAPALGNLQPGVGLIDPLNPPKPKGNRWRNGLWRPNRLWSSHVGLRIALRHEPHVTHGDVLRVPMRFQTPVLNDFQRQYLYDWSTFDTVRVGQKTRPHGRQLLELPVTTMLLDKPAAETLTGAWVWRGASAPQKWLDELKWIQGYTPGSQPQVFRLIISQPAVWKENIVNTLATLTSLEPSQKTEEVGTEYLSLTFKEFSPDEELRRKQRPQHHGPKRWTLRRGETLYEIAKKSHFHRPSAWKIIAKANGIKGVSPGNAPQLAAWAKKHHKKQLVIPAKGRS